MTDDELASLSDRFAAVRDRLQDLTATFREVQRVMIAAFGPCWLPPHRKGRFTCCACGYRSTRPYKVVAHRRARLAPM